MEKKIEKRRRTKKLFADALEVGKNPKEIAMFLMQEEKKRTTQEQAAEVKKTPKETVELLVQAAEEKKAQEQAEAERKEQEKMEELEERTVEKKGGAVAAQVSNMAAYLFKKDQERKLEKLKIEQEVTAALKAGKSPVEIAKFLTKVEEERLKVEEGRRAKKANEYLVTRALKKGKTPGEIAAILLKNKEAQNQPDQELKRETLNRTPKDAAVAGGKSCKVEPHVDVAGVDDHSSEEKDNEDAASDANVLTEKQVKIELEIQKLKADLGKAELVQKEIEKLKADLFRAELKIKSLEEENHDDEEDTSFNDSELGDDLEYDQLAGFFRCFPIRVLTHCV